MKRSTAWFLMVAGPLVAAACANPEVDKRLTVLETKVEALQGQVENVGKGGAPAAGASEEEERAGAELLKQASEQSANMEYDAAKATLAKLKSEHGNTRAARAASRLEAELAIVGKDASDLMIEKWHQGNVSSLTDSEATLLVFWEVWCPHCKREVPKLSESYSEWKAQGLEVIGLTKQSRNVSDEDLTSFLKDNKVTFPIAKEKEDAMSQYYGVRGVPAAAVVKGGKVVWRGHPAKLTDSMINDWVGS